MIKIFEDFTKKTIIEEPNVNLKKMKAYNDIYTFYRNIGKSNEESRKYYMRFMKKILDGKYVKFIGRIEGKDVFSVNRSLSGNVRKIRPDGSLLYLTLDDDIEYLLYPGYSMSIYDKKPEIKNKDVDPYGEEDWDD